MTAPRPLQGEEEDMMQAELKNKSVWVPDDKEGYLSGVVLREEGDIGEVSVGFEVSIRNRDAYNVF